MGSAVLGAHEIAVDSFCDSLAVHVLYEAIDVQSEFVRVTNKVLSLERVLMGEYEVEPPPELALVRGCFRCFCSQRPMWVVGKMPHDVTKIVTELPPQIFQEPVACAQYSHSKSMYSTSVSLASSGPRMWSTSGSTAGSSTMGRSALSSPHR